MKCEKCKRVFRTNTAYPTQSKKYLEWIEHNKEVKRSGFGSLVCWDCWNNKPIQKLEC